MEKYLPEDIEIVDVMVWHKEYTAKPDIVIGHLGHGMNHPHWAYISPKAVISERNDDVVLSYFTDRDVLFSYRPDQIDYMLSKGINAVSWPRPVEPEIFYQEDCPKLYDVFTSGVHDDWPQRTQNVLDRLGRKHMVIDYTPVAGPGAEYDFCPPGSGDDKLRRYYCSSRYHLSLVSGYEYFPGFTNFGIETGNAEAAFCGTISIVLDAPGAEYLKYWYGNCAIFVKPEEFEERLHSILLNDYALTVEAIDSVKALFSADIVWRKFWDAIRCVLR